MAKSNRAKSVRAKIVTSAFLSQHHRTQAEQKRFYNVMRLRSQVTNPTPMVPSMIAEGVGMTVGL